MKKRSKIKNEQKLDELTNEEFLNSLTDEQIHTALASLPDQFFMNEFIRRGLMTPLEGQISLMTKELPFEIDNEENEGEEWKKTK